MGRPGGKYKRLLTIERILARLRNEHLSLEEAPTYWYFVYDNGTVFRTHSVYVYRLNQLSLDQWVLEGRELILRAEGVIDEKEDRAVGQYCGRTRARR